MAKESAAMEKSESPASESREHSADFLKKAVRAKVGKEAQSRYGAMRKMGRAKSSR